MSNRGWKYRCYADEPETPIADFFCCLLGGIIGFYGFPGWVLVHFGVLSNAAAIIIGAIIGLLFGARIIYEGMRERREENARKNQDG